MTTPRQRSSEPLAVAVEPIRPEPRPATDELSVISIINSMLRHRWLIVALALLGGLYLGWKSMKEPRLYTTEAQFMPKGSRGTESDTGTRSTVRHRCGRRRRGRITAVLHGPAGIPAVAGSCGKQAVSRSNR